MLQAPDTLPSNGLLESLSAEERAFLQSYGDMIHHDKGDTVVAQGIRQSYLHLVADGELQVKVTSPEAVVPLGYVAPGGCVGEMSLVQDEVEASANVVATAPTYVWALSRSRFEQFLGENPVVGCKLVLAIASLLASRLRKGSERLLKAQD